MLKGQDSVVLLKLIANTKAANWPQRKLAAELKISLSEINASLKRLQKAKLIRTSPDSDDIYPILSAAEEYILHSIKYTFPIQLGEYTRGIPTGIAAPVFENQVAVGDDPLPVWPHAQGTAKGVALKPLYKTVPQAILEHPDEKFYALLALVDIIRSGRARERNIATQIIKDKLKKLG